MAKKYLFSAYGQVPIHNTDSFLLGLEWEGRTYIDKTLAFGFQSGPKLFSAEADSLAWALECKGIQNSLHYLDDFLFWPPPESPSCEWALSRATALFSRLGLPVVSHKTVQPCTSLTFLGI